jgi:hypothetical protein
MPRRSRRAERALGVAGVLCALAVGAPARAELSGGVDGRMLFDFDGRYGGALLADLWGTRSVVRPGASFGIAALSKSADASSRVLTPLALSLAVVPSGDASGFVGVVRLGGYAGAEKSGFIVGGFGSCALGYGIALGEGASVRVAADLWGLIGRRGGLFVGPSIGLGF